jgi:hypothetical protein
MRPAVKARPSARLTPIDAFSALPKAGYFNRFRVLPSDPSAVIVEAPLLYSVLVSGVLVRFIVVSTGFTGLSRYLRTSSLSLGSI